MIPIHFGYRIGRERLGWAADFCPFCRALAPHRVWDVVRSRHINFIPSGSREPLYTEAECGQCNVAHVALPGLFRDFTPSPLPLEALIARTAPRVRETYQKRLALEVRRIENRLSASDRDDLIAEPFELLNERVAARARETHLDAIVTLAGLTGLACIIAAFVFTSSNWARAHWAEERREQLVGAAIIVALLLFVVSAFTGLRRYIRRRVLPVLALALAPLAPSAAELDGALQRLRRKGLLIARKVPPDAVLEHIARRPLHSLNEKIAAPDRREGAFKHYR